MEDQHQTTLAVTTQVKLDRLINSAIRSLTKRTIYKFATFSDISDQLEHFSNKCLYQTAKMQVTNSYYLAVLQDVVPVTV